MSRVPSKIIALRDGRNCVVRTAEVTDAVAMLDFLAVLRSDTDEFNLSEPGEFSPSVEQEQDWLKMHLENPGKLVLVAEAGCRIIGIIDFSNGRRNRIAHTGELGMGVVADWRGQGLGQALMESLLEWARSNELIEKVSLRVHATNGRARSLYRKMGFVEEGVFKNDLRYGPGRYVDTVFMSRFVKP